MKMTIKTLIAQLKDFINHKKILFRYPVIIKRIKRSIKEGKKVRVAFLATEDCKWNYDSLYRLFKTDALFEPILLFAPRNSRLHNTTSDIQKNLSFFLTRYPEVQLAYNFDKHYYISLKKFNPDIVFYTQPWDIHRIQNILKVSKYALTCYCPYPLAESPETLIVNLKKFHINLWKHFVIAEDVRKQYRDELDYDLPSINITGHPKLDVFLKFKSTNSKNYVIYAPHSSFPSNSWCKCATFEWNGLHILEYAKKHPEFNWVFKPHPDTYNNIIRNKIMSKEETDAYYSEWEKIGLYYNTGDYFPIFQDSQCLITDCISFLGEYFPTQKPVIHLRSKFTVNYMALNKEIIKHYYQAWNINELDNHLKNILEQGKDPMKEERIKCLKQMGLGTTSAAKNIIKNIKQSLGQ